MMGTLPPNPQDLTLHCHPRTTEHRGERTHPGLVWPLSQRSGRIPALPYPLLRPAPVCQKQVKKPSHKEGGRERL